MRLIVTRPQPAADITAMKLRRLGHEVEVSPLLEIESTGEVLPSGQFDALAITSANALRVIDQCGLVAELSHLPLFAVGDATASLARNMGFPIVHSASGRATDLAGLIAKVVQARARILFARGENVAGSLTDALAQAGHTLEPWVLYRSNLVEQLTDKSIQWIGDSRPIGVLLFSPRSARWFNELARRVIGGHMIDNIIVFGISGNTKQHLEKSLQTRCLVARSPDETGIFQLIEEVK